MITFSLDCYDVILKFEATFEAQTGQKTIVHSIVPNKKQTVFCTKKREGYVRNNR